MQIALFRGVSLVSKAIRFITRSPYSHAAFRFDADSETIAAALIRSGIKLGKLEHWKSGSVVEAWQGGVKNSRSISTLHTRGTVVDLFDFCPPLTQGEEEALIAGLVSVIGDPYSFLGVIKFLTKQPGNLDGSWFCSELCFDRAETVGRILLERTAAWEVPPDWLQRSSGLISVGRLVTD